MIKDHMSDEHNSTKMWQRRLGLFQLTASQAVAIFDLRINGYSIAELSDLYAFAGATRDVLYLLFLNCNITSQLEQRKEQILKEKYGYCITHPDFNRKKAGGMRAKGFITTPKRRRDRRQEEAKASLALVDKRLGSRTNGKGR